MPSLHVNAEVTCENCGTQTTKLTLARTKKRYSAGILYFTQCPNFHTKLQNYLNFHFAMKHRAPNVDVFFKCKLCYRKFPGFYALRQHKSSQHCFRIKTAIVDLDDNINEVDGTNLKEELRSCQHFLVFFELERAKHKVFNYAIAKLKAETVNGKLDYFFHKLECAAKVNLSLGFILKIC